MEARDNIAHQIKEAVRKSETKTFSSMERVWDRIEQKLEEEQKEKRVIPFRKIAIAAAILLLLSLSVVYVSQTDNVQQDSKPVYVQETNRNTNFSTPSINASEEIAKKINTDNIPAAKKTVYSGPRQRTKARQRTVQPEAIANHIDVNAINLKNQSLENQELYVAPKTIKGSITDEHGEGIAGVIVLVKGTNKSTLTDLNGNYEIELRDGQAELEVKGIGFISKTIDINKSEHILATTLEPDNKEVANIAIYGKKTDGQISDGSDISITSKNISSRPVTDISLALEGEVPGVKIAHVKARSGASDIMIRGISTPGAGSPLIVIDGSFYNGSLVSLKPDEVESLTVLKDGNATSIYGSKGVNGVIVIKTKNGKGYSMPKENVFQKMKNMFNKKEDKKGSGQKEE